eukprot:scaffold12131_cov112-Isochrysis_galbana.AAC.15
MRGRALERGLSSRCARAICAIEASRAGQAGAAMAEALGSRALRAATAMELSRDVAAEVSSGWLGVGCARATIRLLPAIDLDMCAAKSSWSMAEQVAIRTDSRRHFLIFFLLSCTFANGFCSISADMRALSAAVRGDGRATADRRAAGEVGQRGGDTVGGRGDKFGDCGSRGLNE